MAQEAANKMGAQRIEVMAGCTQSFDIRHWYPVDPFQCQNALAASGPVDFGYAKSLIVRRIVRHL